MASEAQLPVDETSPQMAEDNAIRFFDHGCGIVPHS
jgi:hypothetical protein